MGCEHHTHVEFMLVILVYHNIINGIPIEKELRISTLFAGVYSIKPPQPRYTFIWDVKKVIDFITTSNSPSELSLKDITLKLTLLLALTPAARVSEIGFTDIWYLIKHSFGYTFHFGKNTKTSKRSKSRDLIKFHIFKENQSLCFCQCIDLHLKSAKETQGQNSQLLLRFVKSHGPVSTPTISKWIMIVRNLSGTDTKTFTGHSTGSALSSKATEAGAPTEEILKHGSWPIAYFNIFEHLLMCLFSVNVI